MALYFISKSWSVAHSKRPVLIPPAVVMKWSGVPLSLSWRASRSVRPNTGSVLCRNNRPDVRRYLLLWQRMRRNPLSGGVYLFLGKHRDTIKILHWENDGFVLISGRWSVAHSKRPVLIPSAVVMKWSEVPLSLSWMGVSIRSAKYRKRFMPDQPVWRPALFAALAAYAIKLLSVQQKDKS